MKVDGTQYAGKDGIEIVHVAMPLKKPWRTAYGSDNVIESVLVKSR